MAERHIPGRLAAIMLTGAAIFSACSEKQVNGIHVVDCTSGPKQGGVTLELPAGNEIVIGGDGTSWSNYIVLTSEGNGNIDFSSGYTASKAKLMKNSDGSFSSLQFQGISLDKNGDINFIDGDKSYDVKVGIGDSDTTKLEIKVACNN